MIMREANIKLDKLCKQVNDVYIENLIIDISYRYLFR